MNLNFKNCSRACYKVKQQKRERANNNITDIFFFFPYKKQKGDYNTQRDQAEREESSALIEKGESILKI